MSRALPAEARDADAELRRMQGDRPALDAIRDDCHYRLRIHDHNGFRVFSLRYHEDPDSDRFDTAITCTLALASIADATFEIEDATLARMLRYIAEARNEPRR